MYVVGGYFSVGEDRACFHCGTKRCSTGENGCLAEDSVEAGGLGGLIRNLFHMLGVKRVDLGVKRLPSVLWQSNLSPMNH